MAFHQHILNFDPLASGVWGFELGQVAEVQDGARGWVRCKVVALEIDSQGRQGIIVRTKCGEPGKALYVTDRLCLRQPALTAEEAFRLREQERERAIEARWQQSRQAQAKAGARQPKAAGRKEPEVITIDGWKAKALANAKKRRAQR